LKINGAKEALSELDGVVFTWSLRHVSIEIINILVG
jgi:hypothetical protein